MDRKRKSRYLSKVMLVLLCTLLAAGSSTAAWAKSSKAARIRQTFFAGEKGNDTLYGVSAAYPKQGKLGKRNLFSARFIVQKSLLSRQKDFDFIYFSPMVECYLKNGNLAGSLYAENMLVVVKGKKKYQAFLATLDEKIVKAGKKLSVRENAKELIITVKNLPLPIVDEKLVQNRKYTFEPVVWFSGKLSRKVRAYIDTDYLTFTAQKRHKMTFEKKDYKDLHAMKDDGYPLSVRVVSR